MPEVSSTARRFVVYMLIEKYIMYCIGFTFKSDYAYFIHFNLQVNYVLGINTRPLKHVMLLISLCTFERRKWTSVVLAI